MQQNWSVKEGDNPPFLLDFVKVPSEMINAEQIREIAESLIEDETMFVVDVKFKPSNLRQKVTLLLDTDAGISIDECGELSRKLGKILDEKIENAYTLEVSSPGIDTPLKLARQYPRNLGKMLRVIRTDGTEVSGILESADPAGCVLQPEKKKKEKVKPEPVKISFDDIKEAKVLVMFK